ncbi:MAG: LysR family transcriptional regulator [Pseudomonadota bacterium]
MDNWDDHRLILAIYRAGTLRAAAERLNVTHTTVARKLSALETSQPMPLFVRSGRSYRISDYGKQCIRVAERMEALNYEAERLRRGAADTLSGPLSLSVPRAFLQLGGLLDDLDGFAKAHPGIELSIVASDSLADLDRGQSDVVLRGQIGPDPHLVGRLVSPIGLKFYGQRDYLEATSPDAYQWISAPLERSDGQAVPPAWLSASPYPDAPIRLVIDDIVSRFLAVSEGLGLGRLACFMAETDPGLVEIGHSEAVHAYDLWILTHPDLRHAPKVKAVMQWLWDALRRRQDVLSGVRADTDSGP